jgi:hypothetical protein
METLAPDELIQRLRQHAERLARDFDLHYRAIEAERPNVRRRYGVCFADGTIRIRLRHATTGRPLKYSSLVNTLCHELAHLRHFDHGERFKRLYQRILEHARRERIYQPGGARIGVAPATHVPDLPARIASAGTVQLRLFQWMEEDERPRNPSASGRTLRGYSAPRRP